MADDGDASVASRTTLSTLPLEIKARICELASLQDERYKKRWIPGALGEELVKVHKNEWRGRSLAALSETCKEFNELAAKHIFHTLTDTQIDSLEFTLVVLAQHSFRVRRVLLQHSPVGVTFVTAAAAAQRVFAALPLLPNLSNLHTTVIMVDLALGNLNVPPDKGRQGVIRNAFRGVARRLRTVALDLVDMSTTDRVVTFLKTCSRLQELTISGSQIFDEPTGGFAEYLSTIPTLERLTLDATSAGSAGLHFASGWPTLELLSSLALINIELEAESVEFINRHSPSLRHLTLRLPDESPPTPPPSFPTFLPLPQLSSFTLLNTSCDPYLAILAAIALATPSSAMPSKSALSHLSIGHKAGSLQIACLKSSLKPFKALQSLRVTGDGSQYAALQSHLKPFKTNGILSAGSPYPDAFTYLSVGLPQLLAAYPLNEVIKRYVLKTQRDSLREALAHGEQLVERYFQEGNTDGMSLMLRIVGDIWGDKLLQDD